MTDKTDGTVQSTEGLNRTKKQWEQAFCFVLEGHTHPLPTWGLWFCVWELSGNHLTNFPGSLDRRQWRTLAAITVWLVSIINHLCVSSVGSVSLKSLNTGLRAPDLLHIHEPRSRLQSSRPCHCVHGNPSGSFHPSITLLSLFIHFIEGPPSTKLRKTVGICLLTMEQRSLKGPRSHKPFTISDEDA